MVGIFIRRRQGGKKRIGYLKKACEDGRRQLNDVGYAYAVAVTRKLVDWGDPDALQNLRIERIDDFYELKLKGNVLGRQNLRVFFSYHEALSLILVLGTYIKNEEGATPEHIKIKMRNRHRAATRQLASKRKV